MASKKAQRGYGQNKAACTRYKNEGRREKNKARKAANREKAAEKRLAKREASKDASHMHQ